MAGMQRFVTYIYAYDEGKRSENAGYAKIETRSNSGRMEIHFMRNEITKGVGSLFFLFVQNERIFSVPAGEFQIDKGTGGYNLLFQTKNFLDSAHDFDEMDGICVKDSNGKRYISFWKDIGFSEITEELFLPYKKEEMEPEQKSEPEAVQLAEESDQELSQSIEDVEQESLHTMEIPMQNIFPTYCLADIWERFQKNRECIKLKEDTYAIQIELRELRELPKKYWYLGNNSFLLHGFFNYRYLLFGKMDENNWFLGVPGVYQKQERVMASVFGFPEFLTFSENEISELQPGVWYYFLED